MVSREKIVKGFSACPRCGHFLSSLLAILGDGSLDEALKGETGPWLEFPWHPSVGELLTTYYDWRVEFGTEGYSGRCPSCLRRIGYSPGAAAEVGDEAIDRLQLERRPGSRI
jgi:hypothetical protein